jgi:hypothetical protein
MQDFVLTFVAFVLAIAFVEAVTRLYRRARNR